MLHSEKFDPQEEAYEGGSPLGNDIAGFGASSNKTKFWADAIPQKQGLYDPEYERDACGVGFVANIKGNVSHKIVSDARYLLCNMTHRGAVSSGGNGDGAGILVGIPHEFMRREFKLELDIDLPAKGQYAVGNFFFKKDAPETLDVGKRAFEDIAQSLGLSVLGWRSVPHDSSLLGAVALSREPAILQPLVVLTAAHQESQAISGEGFKSKYDVEFQTQLYILRKKASSTIGIQNWFYACSLNTKTIVYKGQLTPTQVYQYYHDLTNAHFESHMALVHSRFSTNTFPSWDRAQPLRWIAHNGEINTLRGNKNWMRSREGIMASDTFKENLEQLYPIIEEGGSDSAALDNVLELLVINGALSLPEAIMMMVPEAYHKDMDSNLKAWFDWAACLMEPWDGPALLNFTDGRYCGAMLDRNGLRPCRYYITSDDRVICASEVGVIQVDNSLVVQKGKLKPGEMLLVDTELGEMVDTKKMKAKFSKKQDFKSWLSKLIKLEDLLVKTEKFTPKKFLNDRHASLKAQQDPRLLALGYTFEQVSMVLAPMALGSKEALGSMGNDAPLACLNEDPVLLYDYFRQLFAQVTNPPIDPIREANVMSLECHVGPQGNLLEVHSSQCDRLLLRSPILQWREFEAIKNIEKAHPTWSAADIDITFEKSQGLLGYTAALERITQEASDAIDQGKRILMISDRKMGADRVPLSSLIAVGAIHHHLIRNKQRSQVALILETGEAREVHHFCVLLGYGCDGIFPYLAMETLVRMNQEGLVRNVENDEITIDDATLLDNYKHAVDGGILKVMSKMGISTLASYKGAQIFESLGIDNTVVDLCFAGTASRIQGVTFEYIAQDAFSMHERGFPSRKTISKSVNLPESGEYHWRDGGAKHINDPTAIASLQDSVRNKNEGAWEMYVKKEMESIRDCTLRGLLELNFEDSEPIPLEQVEPWTEIARRFATGAMSYGSISMEAHSTLAVAMNRLGAKSNCGEGGEDSERSIVHANGDTMRSAIKQVASARFGVTSHYLSDADEIQIKIAQGAKPGEGGELPAHKVSPDIGKTRHSTPYVGLISPPPHHDIYSIEDLKQLIYDLKCANPRAGISVKLVSEVGVGIVASGVAKAKADHILVSGHDGGTGASRWTGIKYAGLPWELGLAETHQTLVLNDLRRNVVVQTDGQLRTGFDIAVAVLLGAESFTLATVPLIAMGCIMLRKCHLNACAVGIATQDPLLREKFKGQPEHVINFFYYLIQDLRKIMAKLGFRTIDEMVGHSEKLRKRENVNTKAINIDLSPILTPAHVIRPGVATKFTKKQDHKLHTRLDNKLIDEAEITLDRGLPVNIDASIINTDRALGATLSYRISKKFGEEGLPQDTVVVNIEGSAGQTFGAFLASGVTFILDGDANDYVGKGLSGGRLVIRPPANSKFKSDENVIVGNTCFYGATSGTAFISGVAGERFGVRNSGATIVVERIKGNNAFEYMTGGRAVVLSQMESLNAFSGATGGIAYCLTSDHDDFVGKINLETVELQNLVDPVEIAFVKNLIQEHFNYTKSELAARILGNFNHYLKNFVKVIPTDYKKVLEKAAAEESKMKKVNTANFLKKFSSSTDLKSDATNGEVDGIRNSRLKPANSVSHRATLAEPKVQDLEDAVQDVEQVEKKAEKIEKVRGFMLYKVRHEKYRATKSRTKDWKELSNSISKTDAKYQTARCMDCGVPFCTADTGCPISNVIPKFNELVFKNQWKLALDKLLETNNFPEFTGRVCPAPCQGSCTLGIIDDPVGIKSIERLIIDNGFKEGWITPQIPEFRTGRTVAIIGSGPAGLACADQLNRAGHSVTVYERADRCGGLLMYGIPNMKLDKKIVQRRVDLMAAEGVQFVTSVEIGKDVTTEELKSQHDAVVYAIGSTIPRDLRIPGRDLKNIDFAMSLLTANTQALLNKDLETVRQQIEGKKVIVIGGGDTGNDCLGTSVRHGAASVLNFELLPQPPNERTKDNPWPQWPRVMRIDYGHAEVKEHYGRDPREYCILSKEFIGNEEGEVKAIKTVRVEWKKSESGVWQMVEIPGSEEIFEADVVLLSMGFVGPELFEDLSVVKTKRGTIETLSDSSYSVDGSKTFAAGDCRRGQSLIVWAIQEGRKCANLVDNFLMGSTNLPGNGGIVKRDYKLLEELASTVGA